MNRYNRHMDPTARKWAIMAEAVNRTNGLRMGDTVRGDQIKAGMKLLAYYNDTNEGCDVIEVLGLTDDDKKYGEGGVAFESVKDLMTTKEVKSLKALEAKQDKNEYGYHSYIMAHDLVNSDGSPAVGPWYYLFNGRWSRGSGAEALSFVQLLTPEEEDARWVTVKYFRAFRIDWAGEGIYVMGIKDNTWCRVTSLQMAEEAMKAGKAMRYATEGELAEGKVRK